MSDIVRLTARNLLQSTPLAACAGSVPTSCGRETRTRFRLSFAKHKDSTVSNVGPQKQPSSVSKVQAESKAVVRRLGFAAGQAGQFAMAPQVTGPILFSDAPKPIQELFDDESKKITRIIVVHRDLNTDKDPVDGFVWLWDRMEEANP